MTELIPINKADFNGAEINSVNARELHEVLESKQDLSTWIKKRLDHFIQTLVLPVKQARVFMYFLSC